MAAPPSAPRHEPAATFPIPGDLFRHAVEDRIAHAKKVAEARLARSKMPADKRAEAGKALEAAEKEVRRALDRATADGVVTKAEADEVRAVAESVRTRLASLLGDKHARKHGGKGHPEKKPRK